MTGNNLAPLLAALLAAGSFALKNTYLPGAVAPTQGWFPLRNTGMAAARQKADSLLASYLSEGRVKKNEKANRLEGDTRIDEKVLQGLTASRIGETGRVFLGGKPLAEVTLAAFHLNWCDFYGALFETEYIASKRMPIDQGFPDALLVMGPEAASVTAVALKNTDGFNKELETFFLEMDPPLFDFISKIDLDVYPYPAGRDRLLVMANFDAGKGFTPGVIMILEEKKGKKEGFAILAQYYAGEKSELLQAVVEKGDPNPVLHTGTFGDGVEYIVLQFNGKEFREVYKKKEGQFP